MDRPGPRSRGSERSCLWAERFEQSMSPPAERFTTLRVTTTHPRPRATRAIIVPMARTPSTPRLRIGAALLTIAFVATACGDTSGSGGPDGRVDGDVPWDGLPRYETRLDDAADVEALADGDLSVKYLAPLDPAVTAPPLDSGCVFQDMHDAVWHIEFLAAYPEWQDLGYDAYLDMVLRRETRTSWGGSVRWWPDAPHPETGEVGLLSFSVYAEDTPGNELRFEDVVSVRDRMQSCVGFAPEAVVFVAEGPGQRRLIESEADAFADAGIVATDAASLAGEVEFEIYSDGVGYGTLVVVPPTEPLGDYGPRDVLVLESAPNDIGVVAGLITSQPQNLHSHVNLRLQEKGIPNARIPNATESRLLTGLADRLVRIEANAAGVDVTPASEDEAEAWWAAHRPDVGQPIADLGVGDVASFSSLGSEDAIAYGAKAANLAELSNLLGPEHAPLGFAIPFSAYAAHVSDNGIDDLIATTLVDPRLVSDRDFRRTALDDLRDEIRDAPVDPGLLDAIEEQARGWLGDAAETTRLRFRSSTNVEDLEALTGAGLYDSRSGCLGDDRDGDEAGPSRCLSAAERTLLEGRLTTLRGELSAHPDRVWLEAIIADIEGDISEERPIARALPRVWRSLWNDRAWEEREFYGIDHERAYMGVAVNASFVMERINAVVVTNLDQEAGDPLYRVVSQVGTESVVRPDDPTAIAEVRTVRRGDGDTRVDDTLWTESSLGEGGSLWSDERFAELMTVVFEAHDHFAANVYDDPASTFDLEVKLTADGRVVIKQIRPYIEVGP